MGIGLKATGEQAYLLFAEEKKDMCSSNKRTGAIGPNLAKLIALVSCVGSILFVVFFLKLNHLNREIRG